MSDNHNIVCPNGDIFDTLSDPYKRSHCTFCEKSNECYNLPKEIIQYGEIIRHPDLIYSDKCKTCYRSIHWDFTDACPGCKYGFGGQEDNYIWDEMT